MIESIILDLKEWFEWLWSELQTSHHARWIVCGYLVLIMLWLRTILINWRAKWRLRATIQTLHDEKQDLIHKIADSDYQDAVYGDVRRSFQENPTSAVLLELAKWRTAFQENYDRMLEHFNEAAASSDRFRTYALDAVKQLALAMVDIDDDE